MATPNPAQELQALEARVAALENDRDDLRSILDRSPAVTYRAKASGAFAATRELGLGGDTRGCGRTRECG